MQLVSSPPGTEMFYFPGYAPLASVTREGHAGSPHEVAPFGNLRITGCYAPPRSLSQLRHVLHRPVVPRHPPSTLILLAPFATLSSPEFYSNQAITNRTEMICDILVLSTSVN